MSNTRPAGGVSVPVNFDNGTGADQAVVSARGLSAALPSKQGTDNSDGAPTALAAIDRASAPRRS